MLPTSPPSPRHRTCQVAQRQRAAGAQAHHRLEAGLRLLPPLQLLERHAQPGEGVGVRGLQPEGLLRAKVGR